LRFSLAGIILRDKMQYYLGLGSNVGKRLYNLEKALVSLSKLGINIKKKSSIYETQPKGIQDQPWFLNQVVEIETGLDPDELLKTIKKIEQEMGRKTIERDGPRLIDIDILLAEGEIFDSDELKIPHPRLLKRKFALMPLIEIAPGAVHPILNKTVKELGAECADTAAVRIFQLYR
jgi:2-amino-4-hydroxy-6-hydroxymethyldihydropteridine diphosphokinase